MGKSVEFSHFFFNVTKKKTCQQKHSNVHPEFRMFWLRFDGNAMASNVIFSVEHFLRRGHWLNSNIIPVPKKGNLTLATNYRGISLLPIAAQNLK